MSIRWQAYIPEVVPVQGQRPTAARGRRALGIILRDTRESALASARARYGPDVCVQSVLSVEAEADDLSALRRDRPKPPTDDVEKPCMKCGKSRNKGTKYCFDCCPKELKDKRAYKKRDYRSRQKKRPCKRKGCVTEVTQQSRTGYCKKCAAFMRYRKPEATT